jgi:4-hydroxy-4-methyl-2-oxoglutarate aldolase
VIKAALERINGENQTRAHLEQGELLSQVYARYGVL